MCMDKYDYNIVDKIIRRKVDKVDIYNYFFTRKQIETFEKLKMNCMQYMILIKKK